MRLNREGIRNGYFGTQVYSQEELIAEMGAAYLCQIAQLDTTETIQNSAAYIASWLSHLKNNPKWIVQASSKAREAAEYLLTGPSPRRCDLCSSHGLRHCKDGCLRHPYSFLGSTAKPTS